MSLQVHHQKHLIYTLWYMSFVLEPAHMKSPSVPELLLDHKHIWPSSENAAPVPLFEVDCRDSWAEGLLRQDPQSDRKRKKTFASRAVGMSPDRLEASALRSNTSVPQTSPLSLWGLLMQLRSSWGGLPWKCSVNLTSWCCSLPAAVTHNSPVSSVQGAAMTTGRGDWTLRDKQGLSFSHAARFCLHC